MPILVNHLRFAPRPALLSTTRELVDGSPSPGLSRFCAETLFLVAYFDVSGLTLLFVRVGRFVALGHGFLIGKGKGKVIVASRRQLGSLSSQDTLPSRRVYRRAADLGVGTLPSKIFLVWTLFPYACWLIASLRSTEVPPKVAPPKMPAESL